MCDVTRNMRDFNEESMSFLCTCDRLMNMTSAISGHDILFQQPKCLCHSVHACVCACVQTYLYVCLSRCVRASARVRAREGQREITYVCVRESMWART